MPTTSSFTEALLKGLALLGLASCFLLPALYYQDLPAEIPRHFNIKGQADAYSGKEIIWAMPLLCLLLYAGITLMIRKAHLMNYPTGDGRPHSAQQQKGMKRFLLVLNSLTTLFFGYITWSMIRTALESQAGLGTFTVLLLVLVFLGTVAFYMMRTRKTA